MSRAAGHLYPRGTPADALESLARLTQRERSRIASAHGASAAIDESADKVAALRDAIRALGAVGAAHALVGGVAVGIRSGVPRATLGTDLAVRSTAERAAVVRALQDAVFALRGEFAHSVNFRHVSGEPVQLVFDPGFDAMIERAESLELGGVQIRVVTTHDLIAMKERTAADPERRRSKALRDRADLALLRGDVPDPDEGW